jgi:hypothetical protein
MTLLPFSSIAKPSQDVTLYFNRIDIPSVERTWDNISLLLDNQFHDFNETQDEIDRIHSLVPELIDIDVLGQSYNGLNIISIKITNELSQEQKAKSLVVAHHHAREQITIEAALRFILYLVNNYGIDDTITNYIDTQEIYIIPTVNPDSLEYVVNQGNHWLRKNLRPYDLDNDGLFDEDSIEDVDGDGKIAGYDVYEKTGVETRRYLYTYYEGIDNDGDGLINEDGIGFVDLNRNYDMFWNDSRGTSGWGSDTTTQTYPGTAPFSEPETQVFRDFALKHQFAMAYALHSGINATYFPVDLYNNAPENYLYGQMIQDYRTIMPSGFFPSNNYLTENTIEDNIRTGISGGWGGWMYWERATVVPITLEIYHNASVDLPEATTIIVDNSSHIIEEWKDIFGYFAPEEQYINDLWEDIIPAFDYLLRQTPRLEITPKVISGGTNQGDSVTLNFTSQNLSPRIRSVEAIKVIDEEGNNIASLASINSNRIVTDEITFNNQKDIQCEDYQFKIGNNYTGFYSFFIGANGCVETSTTSTTSTTNQSTTSTSQNTPGFAYWITIMILPMLIIAKRNKRLKEL